MTRITLSAALTALAVATLPHLATDALAKTKNVAGGANLPKSTMIPLTVSECERLGGDVVPDGQCKGTGKSCFVNTLNNGSHMTCINEAN